jgi:pimeloyl-ACP methyl ester carboxylesterase
VIRRYLLASLAIAILASAQNIPDMRSAYAEVPGVRLFYIDSGGTGIPVIFLHPASGSTRSWEHQIDAFVKAGYRFIAYDRRGWGRSIVVSSGSQPGTAADDLEALREYLKIDSFHLVGSAAGGGVALDYALAFPKHPKTLVVASSNVGVADERYNEMSNKLHPAEMLTTLPPHIRELGPSYRAADPGGTDRWLEIEKVSRLPGAPAQPPKNRITFSSIGNIATPTLFIAGGADLYAPPPMVQLFADRVRGSQMVAIPEAGHSTFWETPDRFNEAVLRFLGQHDH